MEQNKEYTWHIAQIEDETPHVKSLYLEAVADRPNFIAGQYLTIKLPHLGPTEGKAYSISSAPHEPLIRITIKQIGAFSNALLTHQVGNIITTSAPYGFFYPESEEALPLVCIAGGIGITPILSIITDLSHKQDPRSLYLFYSNKTEADIVFQDKLEELTLLNHHLSVHHFITRQAIIKPGYNSGRISLAQIQKFIPETDKADFFLCGAMDFTRSLWKSLRDGGVQQQQIYTEGFF